MEYKTLKEEALTFESSAKTKNITELPAVSTNIVLKEESFKNKEGKLVNYKYVEVSGEKYRVPRSVLSSLQVLLRHSPNMSSFKVVKTGEGMDTRYTVIPLG